MAKKKNINNVVAIALIAGLIAGFLGSFIMAKIIQPTDEKLIGDFYLSETAVHVSPHHIRKAMSKGDTSFILVDLRSQEEYEKEHIIGAVSIPAYKDRDHSDYAAVERIVAAFSGLPKDRDIIVYCYSIPCMTGRKVGKMLAEHGIYVKLLGVGWNEWRYYWDLWNHAHEWNQTDVMDYVASGPEPGEFDVGDVPEVCLPGQFGC